MVLKDEIKLEKAYREQYYRNLKDAIELDW